MKIHRLSIREVRGIRQLDLDLGGKNFVIWGPNGAGKSGIVDAIDFLLSGELRRLRGAGSGRVNIRAHGVHVDGKIEDSKVEATVSIPGTADQQIVISRALKTPADLSCPAEQEEFFADLAVQARLGQYVLTRREILNFIAVKPQDRGKQIHALLNLSPLDDIRSVLVTVSHDLEATAERSQILVASEEREAAVAASLDSFDEGLMLEAVNQAREVLGANGLQELSADALLSGIGMEIREREDAATTVRPEDFERLTGLVASLRQSYPSALEALDASLVSLRSEPSLRRKLESAELFEKGLALLDDSGRCPLCNREWEPEELQSHIDSEFQNVKELQERSSGVEAEARSLASSLRELVPALQPFVAAARSGGTAELREAVAAWHTGLTDSLQMLQELTVSSVSGLPTGAKQLHAPRPADELLGDIDGLVNREVATPQELARMKLVRIHERLRTLTEHRRAFEDEQRAAVWAETLRAEFVAAMSAELRDLYDRVQGRFTELYLSLHDHESGSFTAELADTTTGAGVQLDVDFYGRGRHPPNALHSEGHQDSMGLCMYLALAEELAGGPPSLVVLDDVVMSVDRDHRDELCTLLIEEYPDTQFVITTHDRTWEKQLFHSGVVESKNRLQIARWTLETGPIVDDLTGAFDKIDALVRDGEIRTAAGLLSSHVEEMLESFCDAVGAEVRYRSSLRWSLGDWIRPALHAYGEILKNGVVAATSWENEELAEQLSERQSIRKQVGTRLGEEQWGLNPTRHFSRIYELTPEEFQGVVDAFRDLLDLFACSACGTQIRILYDGDERPTRVSCVCETESWGLSKKG